MSTNARIYLDFNATAPLVPAARAAMVEALGVAGNPSSVHADGRAARDRVETARNRVAALVGRPREEIVFTSGGTEANRLGVERLAAEATRRGRPRVVVTTPFEHPSLRGAIDALVAGGWMRREVRDWREADPEATGLLALAASNHELGRLVDLTGLPAILEHTSGLLAPYAGGGCHLTAPSKSGVYPVGGQATDVVKRNPTTRASIPVGTEVLSMRAVRPTTGSGTTDPTQRGAGGEHWRHVEERGGCGGGRRRVVRGEALLPELGDDQRRVRNTASR